MASNKNEVFEQKIEQQLYILEITMSPKISSFEANSDVAIPTADDQRKRALLIASGDLIQASHDPKIWFPSMTALSRILTAQNRELITVIRAKQPDSISALAQMTGRPVGAVTKSLHLMAQYEMIKFVKRGSKKVPKSVRIDAFQVMETTVVRKLFPTA